VNAALRHNVTARTPVRVTRKQAAEREAPFVYEGLYAVLDAKKEVRAARNALLASSSSSP
jgi:hypothetical protein